jgi:hypothetical protein
MFEEPLRQRGVHLAQAGDVELGQRADLPGSDEITEGPDVVVLVPDAGSDAFLEPVEDLDHDPVGQAEQTHHASLGDGRGRQPPGLLIEGAALVDLQQTALVVGHAVPATVPVAGSGTRSDLTGAKAGQRLDGRVADELLHRQAERLPLAQVGTAQPGA